MSTSPSLLCALGLSVLLACTGCGQSVALSTKTPIVDAPNQVRVSLHETDGDILRFVVYNRSNRPLVILRDEVLLVTSHGVLHRKSGGIERTYNVAPGQSQDLNVRFDFDGVAPGEVSEVRLDQALMIDGNPVPIPAIQIRRDE